MIRLYYTVPSEGLETISLDSFSSYRLRRLSSLRPKTNRLESIAAEMLLIHAMRNIQPDCSLPLRIVCSEYGKPLFADSSLHFSLSHTEGLVVCAVGDRDLGVDAERKHPYNEALVRRFFTEKEQAILLESEDPADCFIRLWTLKESYLKALGCGLIRPLDSFSINLSPTIELEGDATVGFWQRCIYGVYVSLCVPGCCIPFPDIIEEVKLP